MKQRIFEVVDCNGWLQHFIMAANIEEARDFEKNPDLIVVDPRECRENNIFSWNNYFILEACESTVDALEYMKKTLKPNQVQQFQNWNQTITHKTQHT